MHLFFARNLQRNPQQLLSEVKENSPLAGIDFTTAFQDEDKVIEGITEISVSPGDRQKSPASRPGRAGYSDPIKNKNK